MAVQQQWYCLTWFSYKNIYYHKQTKNQWARDDPAFVVLLGLALTCSCSALSMVSLILLSGRHRIFCLLQAIFRRLSSHHPLYGLCWLCCRRRGRRHWMLVRYQHVKALCLPYYVRWFANHFLVSRHFAQSTEQSVEWAYAFDVHSNSFLPLFLLTYVLQFFLILILPQSSYIFLIVGNTIYMVRLFKPFAALFWQCVDSCDLLLLSHLSWIQRFVYHFLMLICIFLFWLFYLTILILKLRNHLWIFSINPWFDVPRSLSVNFV